MKQQETSRSLTLLKRFRSVGKWLTLAGLERDQLRCRRAATRVAINVPARFSVHHSPQEWQSARLVDITQNGARLVSVLDQLDVDSELEIHFQLPENETPVSVKGSVVWSRFDHHHRKLECGVEFQSVKQSERKENFIYFITEKILGRVQNISRTFECKPVETKEEMEAALRLVYEEYAVRGYCPPLEHKFYYDHFCLLPNYRAFILKEKGEIIGTIGLTLDSPCGIPADELYPEEVSEIREKAANAQGCIAEVKMLALASKRFKKKAFMLTHVEKLGAAFQIFRIMFDYVKISGVTDLIITMNPKHKDLYRYFCFEQCGPVRYYKDRREAPAIAMHMNVLKFYSTSAGKMTRKYFFENQIDKNLLQRYFKWTAPLVYKMLFEYQNLWPSLPQRVRNYLFNCYPQLKDLIGNRPDQL